MSPRRMVFLGLTVVSALAFAVDRLLLGEPAPAEAAAAPRVRPARASKPVPAEAPRSRVPADPSLAYIERLSEGAGGRDIFSMSPDMLLYYRSLQREAEERAQEPSPGSPEEFRANHVLEGTCQDPAGPMAVINGHVLRPGDIIDEFRITRIDAFGIELRRGRDRVILELPQPLITDERAPGVQRKPRPRAAR